MLKIKYGLFGNDNRVATLSKSYLTITGINIQSLKFKDNSNMPIFTIRAIRYGRKDRPLS